MSKERVSNRAIELRVEWLNKALGRPVKPWEVTPQGNRSNVGNFHVDHQLGGYRLEMMANDGGGVSTPFGSGRMSKSALCDQLEAILAAIKLARGEENGSAWPLTAEERKVVAA